MNRVRILAAAAFFALALPAATNAQLFDFDSELDGEADAATSESEPAPAESTTADDAEAAAAKDARTAPTTAPTRETETGDEAILQATPSALGEGEVPPESTPPPEPPGVEVLIVTGEKIDRDLQSTYTSVSVINSQQIEDFGIRDVRNSLRLVPNVNTSPANASNNGITIRGLNSEGITPGVTSQTLASLVIDGAVQSFAGLRRGVRGLWDVDQIEIFRGPQSTIQGRNAFTGAIVIETNDPSYEWEAAARGSIASFEVGMDGDDQWNGAFMVSGPIVDEQLAFRVSGELARDEHRINFVKPQLEFLDDGQYESLRGKLLFEPNFLPDLRAEFTLVLTHDAPAVLAVDEGPPNQRIFDGILTGVEFRENDVQNYILEINYELSPEWTVEMVASHIATQVEFGTPNPEQFARNETRDDLDFTGDLRFLYDDGERISGIVGLFTGHFIDNVDGNALTLGNLFQDRAIKRKIDNVGVYYDVRLEPVSCLSVQAGLRYDWERRRTRNNNRKDAELKRADNQYAAWLPRATVAFHPSDDVTIALSYSRGYSAGGENIDEGTSFNPQFLHNAEIALRSTALDRRVVFNANVFFNDWEDLQIERISPKTNRPFVENAGAAISWGAELQIQLRPFQGFSVGGSYSYLSTEFTDYVNSDGSQNGNEFPEAPPHQASIFASYVLPVEATGPFPGFDLVLSADFTSTAGFFATADVRNRRERRIESYSLTNVRAGIETEMLDFAVFVSNVFDDNYIVGRDFMNGVYVGDPRLIGLEASLRF